MERFLSVEEAKSDILKEHVDSVSGNLLCGQLLKSFSLDPSRRELCLPSLERNKNVKQQVLRLADSLGFDIQINKDGSMIITKDPEPTHYRSSHLDLALSTKTALTEAIKNVAVESEIRCAKKTANVSYASIGSRCAGRINLTGPPPLVKILLGEDPSAFRHRRSLPIYQFRAQFLEAVEKERVVLLTGGPGSGKTTQVPQYILEHSDKTKKPCRVLCIVPRRISAQVAAERVQYERGVTGNQIVSFHTRLEGLSKPQGQIIYSTTDVFLLSLMSGDRFLESVSHLVVDEVHCRDRYTDLILGIIRGRLAKFANLKMILLSADICPWVLSTYFFKCPIIKVESKDQPPSIFFLEDVLLCTLFMAEPKESVDFMISDVAQMCDDLIAQAWFRGDEVVFVQIQNMVNNGSMSVDHQHRLTGITPLMAAAIHGRIDIAKCFISHGANPTIKVKGLTPYEIAVEFDRPEVADMLLSYGEAFLKEIGSNIVDSAAANPIHAPENIANLFYAKYSKDHVNLDLVVEVISTALGYSLPGSILVILPGYSEVIELRDFIKSNCPKLAETIDLVTLQSHMQMDQYRKYLAPAGKEKRKVVLATNMIESSSFSADVSFVIDSGLVRDRENDSIVTGPRKSISISKASANLRSLHCRNGGMVFRLYSRARFSGFQDCAVPEIARSTLTDVCLYARILIPEDVRLNQFFCSLPDPPPTTNLHNAIDILQHIGALDYAQKVTAIGLRLVDLPVEPRLGKMVLAAVNLKCIDPVLTIVSCLSRDDPFITPASPEERRIALARKMELSCDSLSDHIALLKAYHLWESATEARKRQVCRDNYLSVVNMELIFLLRVQLVGELRANGYVRTKGSCDIRNLNLHSGSWTAVKAALTMGTYPNIGRYSLVTGGVMTPNEYRARFHYTSTLLPQESGLQDMGSDSYFGPPIVSKSQSQLKFRSGLFTCPWLIYHDVEKFGSSGILRNSTVITPITALLFAGHAKLPTVQITNLDPEKQQRHSDLWDNSGDTHDLMEEAELRSLCNEYNMNHQFEQLLVHHRSLKATKERERADQKKHYAQLKVDDFISFTVEHSIANFIFNLRQKYQLLLEKCICDPGYSMVSAEESVLKAVLHIMSSEDSALNLPAPGNEIGRRPSNVTADSILAMPQLKPENFYQLKWYEKYTPPPRGHRILSKDAGSPSAVVDVSEKKPQEKSVRRPSTTGHTLANFSFQEVSAALPVQPARLGRRLCKSFTEVPPPPF